MKNYSVDQSDQFFSDTIEAASWIYESNKDQSEEFSDKCAKKLQDDIDELILRLKHHPDSGELLSKSLIRKSPIYSGRYSAQWIVIDTLQKVILLNLLDLKYPKNLRTFSTDL